MCLSKGEDTTTRNAIYYRVIVGSSFLSWDEGMLATTRPAKVNENQPPYLRDILLVILCKYIFTYKTC